VNKYAKYLSFGTYFVIVSLSFIPLLALLTGQNAIKGIFVHFFWANPEWKIWEIISLDVHHLFRYIAFACIALAILEGLKKLNKKYSSESAP